jgi:site-specific recombinase XerD
MIMKLCEAIGKFRKYTEVTKTKGTQDYYRHLFRSLALSMGNLECDLISNDDILNYVIKIKDINPDLSNATINKHVVALKTIVKYATGREIKFSKLKEKKQIIPTISRTTYSKIFDYYQKHMGDNFAFRNYVFLKLLLDTGLRMSEIINIKINDIDFDTSSIHVKITKTDVERYVCFTESTHQLLLKFIVTQPIKKHVFIDFNTGLPMTTSSVECFIYRLKKRLGIKENITPHKWRHTFATNFIRSGGGLETLRLLLGHSNLKTTQKYLHLSNEDFGNTEPPFSAILSHASRTN